MQDKITEAYGVFVARKRKEALKAVLSNPDAVRREMQELQELHSDLERIYTATDNVMKQ